MIVILGWGSTKVEAGASVGAAALVWAGEGGGEGYLTPSVEEIFGADAASGFGTTCSGPSKGGRYPCPSASCIGLDGEAIKALSLEVGRMGVWMIVKSGDTDRPSTPPLSASVCRSERGEYGDSGVGEGDRESRDRRPDMKDERPTSPSCFSTSWMASAPRWSCPPSFSSANSFSGLDSRGEGSCRCGLPVSLLSESSRAPGN